MTIERITTAEVAEEELALESTVRPRRLDEFAGQDRIKENLAILIDAAQTARGAGRPHPPLRPAGPGQDDAGEHRGGRDGGADPDDERPRHRAGRRPRRGADVARRGRRAVHRRDPSAQPRRRGDPLPGDGGLRARRRARQGTGRANGAAADRARDGDRRHHPRRLDHRAAARPVRRHLSARLLHRGRARAHPAPLGRDPRRPTDR